MIYKHKNKPNNNSIDILRILMSVPTFTFSNKYMDSQDYDNYIKFGEIKHY